MNARQLVSMAPLTTSNSGKTTKASSAIPTACIPSKRSTTKKSVNLGLLDDLKMQILGKRKKKYK